MTATTTAPQLIDAGSLDRLVEAARTSPRRRKNQNFHASNEDVCHRLLNAVEPGSYVVPHRHMDPNKDESFVVLRGRFGLVLFDTGGAVTHALVLDHAGPNLGITIPHGTFHSLVALAPGSVFFEAKAGPFLPLSPEEVAPWAPAEQAPEAGAYFSKLRALFP